ncbi:MAG: class I SAM-dependent methyltransferase [Thermodesulfovibrionales bacterium]|jgi:predicted O-methyltransferase YrrM
MNTILSEILETNLVYTPDGKALRLHSHIPQAECEIIQQWINDHQPHNLLEIGLGYGISSLFICDAIKGMQGITYHIIDAFQGSRWGTVGIFNLKRAGFETVFTFHEELSEICLPGMLKQGMTFDFALIDGFHTFDHTLVDFFYINKMLKPGGIIVFDDIQLPSIKKVVEYVATYDCYNPLLFPDRFLKSVKSRARRMLNIPEFRVHGFLKTMQDNRKYDWHKEF